MKNNSKGITPNDITIIKEKIKNYYASGKSLTLTFYKGKAFQEKQCIVCGTYPSLFRVKSNGETISVNYVDLLTNAVKLNENN